MECDNCNQQIPDGSRFCMFCGDAQKTASAFSQQGRESSGADTIMEPSSGIELLPISGGTFRMGNIWEDGGRDERPVRLVKVSDFFLAPYPVTQAQWQRVMGDNPAAKSGPAFVGENKPVVNISWDDARQFIERLNREGGRGYRLPTEAEWEYAARSGGKDDKWSGTSQEKLLADYAWFSDNSHGRLQEVGKKEPNQLGLFDMSGNIWEWCEDIWHPDYENAPGDSRAWLDEADGAFSAKRRVMRGGSWNFNAFNSRSTYRDWNNTDYRFFVVGLRLAASA